MVAPTCPHRHKHPLRGYSQVSVSGFSLWRWAGQAGGSSPASSHRKREGKIFFQAGFAWESTAMLPLHCPNPATQDVKLKAAK